MSIVYQTTSSRLNTHHLAQYRWEDDGNSLLLVFSVVVFFQTYYEIQGRVFHMEHNKYKTIPFTFDYAGEAVRFLPGRTLTQNCDLAQMTRSSRFNSSCRPAADNQAGSLMNALMEPEDVL